MPAAIDIAGHRFGRLVAIEHVASHNGRIWRCICDCGKEHRANAKSLRSGAVSSCGCYGKERAIYGSSKANAARAIPHKHGRKLTFVLSAMKDRCYNPSNDHFKWYGDKGVFICEEWLADSFSFYKWASENGYQPGLQIDRIDVNGPYKPENCRFVTRSEQMNNTTRNVNLTWRGKTMSVTKWADVVGIDYRTLKSRLHKNWPVDKALSTPVRPMAPRGSKKKHANDNRPAAEVAA